MRALLIFFIIISNTCFSQSVSWYKMLVGKIDKYPVTLHLHCAGHGIIGYYYYNNLQQPVYVTGDDTTIKGKIQLIGYADPNEAEYFHFSMVGDSASGSWKKTEKAKAVNFSAKEARMPINFTYVYSEGNTKLRPRLEDSPEATFSAASVWPTGKSPVEELIKKEIRLSFSVSKKDPGGEIGNVLLTRKKAFLAEYLSDYKGVKNEELKETMAYNTDQTSQLLVAYQSPRILSFAITSYSYTGGAHGNYGTYYASFALPLNKRLSLIDILTKDGYDKLQTLLEKNFRKNFGLKPTDSLTEAGLFDNKIEPNGNFYVTGKGLGFTYNPYEIGPYAMGQIDIFIPFKELEPYLRAGFKSLLQ